MIVFKHHANAIKVIRTKPQGVGAEDYGTLRHDGDEWIWDRRTVCWPDIITADNTEKRDIIAMLDLLNRATRPITGLRDRWLEITGQAPFVDDNGLTRIPFFQRLADQKG